MGKIKNPDLLREKVKKIESKIKAIVETPYHRGKYNWRSCAEQREKIHDLLGDRSRYLNRMFLATPEEVKRFESLNSKLIKIADDIRARAAMLYEAMLNMPKNSDFDEIYEVEGKLEIAGDSRDEETVIKLPEDEYYGSDFMFMSGILWDMMPDGWIHSHCCHVVKFRELGTPDEDPGDSFTYSMEDGQSWAECDLCHPALDHICICHPIHDICNHLHYSIPDLLRINDFKATVSLNILHQRSQEDL